MRILVTGGCGFIGSHLVEHHLNKGDEVSIIDDLSSGTLQNISAFQDHPRLRFLHDNILTYPDINNIVSWADRVYHMAAVVGIYRVLAEPLNVMQTNIRGCELILEAASKCQSPPLVFIASSSSVYGHSTKPLLNENDNLIIQSAEHPLRNYAISKITDEALGFAYHHTYHIPITIVRFFNVVGPRQTGRYGMVVPRFVHQACQNQPITVFGHGNQTRSFCDIRDVVTALELIATKPTITYDIFNIGNNHEISINYLAELVRKHAHSQSEITHISYQKAYGIEFEDTAQRCPDLTKLKQVTGFKHQWTIEKTVDDLISLYRNYGDQR